MKRISNIFRHLACAAAIAATAGFVGACSEEDNIIEQPAEKTILFTATLESKGGAATRSVDASGQTAWQVGEQIAINYYKTGQANSSNAIAKVTEVNADGSATITAPLEDPSNGSTAKFFYPAAYSDGAGNINWNVIRSNQKGTIEDISANHDFAYGTGTITVSGDIATTGTVEMANQVCICKFHLRIGTPGDGDAFTPSAGEFPKLILITSNKDTYTITSDRPNGSGGTRGFRDGDDIYVAMKPLSNRQLMLNVRNETEAFTAVTGNGTLQAGKFYTNIPVTLTPNSSEPITIANGETLTLRDVNITSAAGPVIVCEGHAIISLEGTSTLVTTAEGCPAIKISEKAGCVLTVNGDGVLNVTGGNHAAAIGCGYNRTGGRMTFSSGTIYATGGYDGAGIGSGLRGTCGDINIRGATINATGGENAAGIGTGSGGTCGKIIIQSGSTVNATGGDWAAGIGSGWNGKYEKIEIKKNITSVTATAGDQKYEETPLDPIGNGYEDTESGDVIIDGMDSWTAGEATTNLNFDESTIELDEDLYDCNWKYKWTLTHK